MTAWPAAFRAVLIRAVGAGAKQSAPRASARTTAAARILDRCSSCASRREMRCKECNSSAYSVLDLAVADDVDASESVVADGSDPSVTASHRCYDALEGVKASVS